LSTSSSVSNDKLSDLMDFNYFSDLKILQLKTENFKIIWWFRILKTYFLLWSIIFAISYRHNLCQSCSERPEWTWKALNLSWRRKHAAVQGIKIPYLQFLAPICSQTMITCLEVVWNTLSDNKRKWIVIKPEVVFWFVNLTSDLLKNCWGRSYVSNKWYFWQTHEYFPLI